MSTQFSYYDTREELGVNGYIVAPYRFYRDDEYYDAIWFYNSSAAEREALDIFFAVDVTPGYNPDRYFQLSTFTIVWDVDLNRFDITFDIEEIPLEQRKDRAYVDTNAEGQSILDSVWSSQRQKNIALGIYSDDINAQCANDTAKMMQDAETNKAAIDAISTQEEMDAFIPGWSLTGNETEGLNLLSTPAVVKQRSMLKSGEALTLEDDARISVGQTSVIPDRPAHDTWMQAMYTNADNGVEALEKPPEGVRQKVPVQLEDADPFVFTRYQDQWGWRWRMDLVRDSVNALALYIQDVNGNYLYTTGGLIRNDTDDGWYTECPAGQADPTPENVYFKWILGSAPISENFVYNGSEDELNGIVRSDPEYD